MLRLLSTASRSWQYAQGLSVLAAQQQQHHSFSTSAAQQQQQPQHLQLPDGVMVLPMPALSHSMVSGSVSKWLKAEGEECHMYDLLFELQTDTLVEDAYKVDNFAGTVTMLIETQEEAFVARLLVQEGQEVPVGTPVAVLADDVEKLQLAAEQAAAVSSAVSNVYDDSQQPPDGRIRTLVWQSYLKEAAKESGSCM